MLYQFKVNHTLKHSFLHLPKTQIIYLIH